jgi:hypothetical protein
MPAWLTRDRLALAAAIFGPLLVCAVLSLFRDSFANTDAALVLVLVIVAVAANGYRLAGILASVSAALSFDFFLTAPYNTFSIERRFDVETALLLLAVGVAVTEIAVWGRRNAAVVSEQAGYLAGIRAATEAALSRGSAAALPREVSDQLVTILGLSSCQYQPGVVGLDLPARLRRDGQVEWNGKIWDVDRRGLPTDVDVELLIEAAGQPKGRYLMHAAPDSRPTRAQLLVAVTLASQVGAALP